MLFHHLNVDLNSTVSETASKASPLLCTSSIIKISEASQDIGELISSESDELADTLKEITACFSTVLDKIKAILDSFFSEG